VLILTRVALCFCLLSGLSQTGWSDDARADTVWLLSSRTNSDHLNVVDAFMRRLATAPQIKVRVIDTDSDADTPVFKAEAEPSVLIVAIGSAAARLAHNAPAAQPVLDILIPRLQYEQQTLAGGSRSALYIDQPFERQLNLCRLIAPDLRHLAVLYGPTSQASYSDLHNAARQTDVTLHEQNVAAGTNPNAALDRVLDDSQLLLALPDPEVFTRYTVAGLLLTAYHHAVPVIGFSAAYVKAGALAAVYSTPEQIGRDAAEIVLASRTDTGWMLPTPRYPAYYSVAVNRQVGRSLNLKLPDDAVLLQALTRKEQAQ
jgi:ABC-type uncharacterized transport system substrate-binding protein